MLQMRCHILRHQTATFPPVFCNVQEQSFLAQIAVCFRLILGQKILHFPYVAYRCMIYNHTGNKKTINQVWRWPYTLERALPIPSFTRLPLGKCWYFPINIRCLAGLAESGGFSWHSSNVHGQLKDRVSQSGSCMWTKPRLDKSADGWTS